MRIRLRSLETKETEKIELQDDCSLQQLKDILFVKMCLSPSQPASSVRLSLNGKDEICGSSAQDSLSSLGITSGDLLFYTVDPPASHTPQTQPNVPRNLISGEDDVLGVPSLRNHGQSQEDKAEMDEIFHHQSTPHECSPCGAIHLAPEVIENEKWAAGSAPENENVGQPARHSSTLPRFLWNAVKEGDGQSRDPKFLACCVHFILLESGFTVMYPQSGTAIVKLLSPNSWSSSSSCITMWYNVRHLTDIGSRPVGAIVVKYQPLGPFITVYASFSGNSSSLLRTCLDVNRYYPHLEKQVLELWKLVKDELVLPLMVDLCELMGVVPPPCLMRLPSELKIKILGFLPATDTAKLACTCSEFRHISSSNEMWKEKYLQVFGDGDTGEKVGLSWKERFGVSWENKRKRGRRQINRMRLWPYGSSRYSSTSQGELLIRAPGLYRYGASSPLRFVDGGMRYIPSAFSPHCDLTHEG